MAVPSYTTDLLDVNAAESTTGWTEPTGFTSGAIDSGASEYWIQNPGSGTLHSLAKSMGASAPSSSGVIYTGSAVTIPSPGAAMFWLYFGAPNALAAQASGGLQAFIGHSGANFRQYYVRGADTYTYGGWVCVPVDPVVTPNANTGSPNSSFLSFGGGAYIPTTAVSKGNPLGVDAIRYGRCEARFANGDSGGYATFPGFVANNDLEANRWGLIQAVQGGYLYQGLMVLGYANPVDFRDSNRNLFIADTQKVISTFNTIEVRNASSNVFWNTIQFSALGTTSPGRWVSTDDANVQLTTCTFNNMGTFDFKPKANVVSCTFNGCGQITLSNSHFTSCRVAGSTVATNTSALVWDNNLNPSGYLDGSTFVRGTANNHAVEFGTNSPTAMTLVNMTFAGYNAGANTNDSAIHIKRTTGTVTITLSGTSQPSYSTQGAEVAFVQNAVDATVDTKDVDGNDISDVRVLLKAAAGGPMPSNVTVTIVNSGTNANVHHTAHGMLTNDKVLIDGASHWQNCGVFTITKTDNDYYSYTMPSAPGSDPTGTIKATYVALEGNTTSGSITMSREFTANQAVTGWARKSSSAPYYKTAPLTGTIYSATGYSGVAIMILDQ